MAIETLYLSASVSGGCPNPNNALGNTPTTWAGNVNSNNSWVHTWSFADRPGIQVAGQQQLSLLVRKGSNSGNPSIQLSVLRNGSVVASHSNFTVTSTTGQNITVFWSEPDPDATGLTLQVTQSNVGGSPSTRNEAQVAMATYVADLVADEPDIYPVTGVVDIFSTTSADIVRLAGLGSQIPAISEVFGDILLRRDYPQLSGAVTAITTVAGSLSGRRPLNGRVDTATVVTGSPTKRTNVTGTVPAVTALTGSITASTTVQGRVTVISGASGSLVSRTTITGRIDAVTKTSGLLTIAPRTWELSGQVTSTTTVSGSLTKRTTATGSVPVLSTLSGYLDVIDAPKILPVMGQVQALSTVSGGFGWFSKALYGSVDAITSISYDPTTRFYPAGQIDVIAGVNGSLSYRGSLTGTSVASSTVSGSLSAYLLMSGISQSFTMAQGALLVRAGMMGITPAVSTFTGELTYRTTLNGVIDAVSDAFGLIFIVVDGAGRPSIFYGGEWISVPAKAYVNGLWVQVKIKIDVGGWWVERDINPDWEAPIDAWTGKPVDFVPRTFENYEWVSVGDS